MLVINPDECIDCGVCEPECPINAIQPDTDKDIKNWIELNTKYSEGWPNITKTQVLFSDSEKLESPSNL